jgi:hypothetical protein
VLGSKLVWDNITCKTKQKKVTLQNMKNKKIYAKKVQPIKLENVLNRVCWELFRSNLARGTIFLIVIHFLLHHVACAKTIEYVCDNFCATFKRKHIGNRLQLR